MTFAQLRAFLSNTVDKLTKADLLEMFVSRKTLTRLRSMRKEEE